MAASEPQNEPFAEFIGDYFVECDEHLAVARQSLLALEPFVGQPELDRALVEELFRSFHSVKGLSAMVGVRGAEGLAHQMESYLGALRKGQAQLTAAGLDTLIEGVGALEQVIAARRDGTAAPDITRLLEELVSLAHERPAAEEAGPSAAVGPPERGPLQLSDEKIAALERALQAGARAWRFTFVPSPALAERGVNVNTVRKRLQEIGELIQAAPVVLAGGQIAFVFFVTSTAVEADLAPLQDDGLTCTPYEPAPAEEPKSRSSMEHPVASAGVGSPLTPSNVVRVDLARLDELMRLVGELVISRGRLEDGLNRLGTSMMGPEWRVLQETNQAFERQLRDLREGVMRVRLVPVREVFARMQFVVRDLVRELGKKVSLALSGQETEIDKYIVERLMDPLLHLVRNAVSHGLETPEERVARGKPPEGKLALRASTTGETIVIEVEDDGRGVDSEAVFARARSAGLIDEGAACDAAALLDIICTPGFSTRDQADRTSGRGVGMAVVRGMVEELGGTLALYTEAGQGSRFTIRLPLTLAIADALIVEVGGQSFAVPQVSVREVIRIEPAAVKALENNELVPYRDGVLPLLRLAGLFGLSERVDRAFYMLVTGSGAAAVGLAVTRVLTLREIVVRPLNDPLVRVPGVAGATELGDGRVVLILDTAALARVSRKQARAERPGRPLYAPAPLSLTGIPS